MEIVKSAKGIIKNLIKIINSAFVAWGLVILLMLMLAVLGFLRNRRLVEERLAALIIVTVMLQILIALNVNIE